MALFVNTRSEMFVNCDFTDVYHCTRLCELVNTYVADPKGGGIKLMDRQKLHLLDGLETSPNAIVLFLLVEEQILGYTVGFLNFSTFKAAPMFNIHDFFLEPAFRGKGYGRMMLRKVVDIATDLNCAKVTLEVRKDNQIAQLLYFSEDFSPTNPEMLFWVKEL